MNFSDYLTFLEPIQGQLNKFYSGASLVLTVLITLWLFNFLVGLIQRTFSVGKAIGVFYRTYIHRYLRTLMLSLFNLFNKRSVTTKWIFNWKPDFLYSSNISKLQFILTSNGIPFRESHIAISKLTKKLEKEGKSISDLSGSELSKILGKDIDIDINISINSRNIVAGTSEDRVKEEIKAAKKILNI